MSVLVILEIMMIDDANEPTDVIPSPCVRNCCLDENDICLGCHRTISEITGWSNASMQRKREILEMCHLRLQRRNKRVRID